MSPIGKIYPIDDWKSVPEFHKMTLKKGLALGIINVFKEIAKRYESEPDTKEVREDCFHLFRSAPPRYSLAEIVQWTRTIFAIIESKQSFKVKSSHWGTKPGRARVLEVRNKVTSRAIRRFIKYR